VQDNLKEGGMAKKHNTGTFKKRHFKYLKTQIQH
jgi:hypothetical protein